jgi:hypothetical protein
MVYKLNGYKLLRDASQQATQGEALSFIEESEPGDLAFLITKKVESLMWASLWKTIILSMPVENELID